MSSLYLIGRKFSHKIVCEWDSDTYTSKRFVISIYPRRSSSKNDRFVAFETVDADAFPCGLMRAKTVDCVTKLAYL